MNEASKALALLDLELFYSVSIGWGEIKLQGNVSSKLLKYCKDCFNVESFELDSASFLNATGKFEDVVVKIVLT